MMEFGKLICEKYHWNRGNALPVSPIDGYQYRLEELVSLVDGIATFERKQPE